MNDKDALDAFILGFRVTYLAHDIKAPATEALKVWDLLREIADGTATLVTSHTEQMMKHPKMEPNLRERLAAMTNRLVQKDRELARRIYDAFDASV